MIEKPTVLILGAGASNDYGFPTGRQLLTNIIKTNAPPSVLSDKGKREWALFLAEVQRTMPISIDDFLESRPEFIESGTIAISYYVGKHEALVNLRPTDSPRLYEFLWWRLRTGDKKDLVNNNLRIVTFNYDRSLEYALFNAIRGHYGIRNEVEASELLRSAIPIHHVYGSLGLPDFDGHKLGNKHEVCREYKIIKEGFEYGACIKGIKLVEQRGNDPENITKVHEWLSEAEAIIFLGFGYDKVNLERLKIKENSTGKLIAGTALHHTDAEIEEFYWRLRDTWTNGDDKLLRNQGIMEFLTQTAIMGVI